MNLISKTILSITLGSSWLGATAQDAKVEGFVHRQSDPSGYEWPTDTAVLANLDRWQDQKFGVTGVF